MMAENGKQNGEKKTGVLAYVSKPVSYMQNLFTSSEKKEKMAEREKKMGYVADLEKHKYSIAGVIKPLVAEGHDDEATKKLLVEVGTKINEVKPKFKDIKDPKTDCTPYIKDMRYIARIIKAARALGPAATSDFAFTNEGRGYITDIDNINQMLSEHDKQMEAKQAEREKIKQAEIDMKNTIKKDLEFDEKLKNDTLTVSFLIISFLHTSREFANQNNSMKFTYKGTIWVVKEIPRLLPNNLHCLELEL
jgi:hypothetical protein